eukprot:CAMPEP_0198309430 /NCGR_PEP_ID=MMETSP1450-20131203/1831_1 /TAXON_ID=753684 ORGANISM="Madagascaria erythrocladiodes, Strain CCMP3234" /NCGR_SAMPLE_ID=MMETSP1450 /ASSEMBLY_ACC=CAM_ASM_001115 /LENGTH=149 /DNA_ID=CAMNT_0044012187 /DNA_START=81 /DNA_END=526 /DNA_ORIENTATION=+
MSVCGTPAVDVIVKVGGAALTDKSSPSPSLHVSAVAALTDIVARLVAAARRVVLVHGAGSYGHGEARRGELTRRGLRRVDDGDSEGGDGDDDAQRRRLAFVTTRLQVSELNARVCAALVCAGVPALPVHVLEWWLTSTTPAGGTDVHAA